MTSMGFNFLDIHMGGDLGGQSPVNLRWGWPMLTSPQYFGFRKYFQSS